MKRIIILLFVFFSLIQAYTQSNKNWITDLDTLESNLLQKEHLFTKFLKKEFENCIDSLKTEKLQTEEKKYWLLFNMLNKFNHKNIQLQAIDFDKFPFEIKQFKNNFYITSIHLDFEHVLGYKLEKINNFTINHILKKAKTTNNINIKSFLEFYQFSKTDTLNLELLSKNKETIKINIFFDEFYDREEMAKITPKKTPFYLQKQDRWFWQYGINFGQQVYFKYNIGLSKEYLDKMKDSFKISELNLARRYQLPLHAIYDAPTFDDFTDKLFLKLKKRRYKKLFIDFRNMKTGNALVLDNFIKKLKKTKRINKKNRLYILIDKNLSSAAIEMVLKLQKETKATIVGEKNIKISCSTYKINKNYLLNSEFKVSYISQKNKLITIQPDIEIQPSFAHYLNGIDPILQKALNL